MGESDETKVSTGWTRVRSGNRFARAAEPTSPVSSSTTQAKVTRRVSFAGSIRRRARSRAVQPLRSSKPRATARWRPIRNIRLGMVTVLPRPDAQGLGLLGGGDADVDRQGTVPADLSALAHPSRGSNTAGDRAPLTVDERRLGLPGRGQEPAAGLQAQPAIRQDLRHPEADLVHVGDEEDVLVAPVPRSRGGCPWRSISGFAQEGRCRAISSRTGPSAPLTP